MLALAPALPKKSETTSPIPGLSQKSCLACQRRKVKCDKRSPCSRCSKRALDCVYPPPGTRHGQSRQLSKPELLARLERLEGVVKDLEALREDRNGTASSPTVTSTSPESPRGIEKQSLTAGTGLSEQSRPHKDVGRLVINDSRSRYISHQTWTMMGKEISEIHDLLDESSEEDTSLPYLQRSTESGTPSRLVDHGFLFGWPSAIADLKDLRPSPSDMFLLQNIFLDNVDPLTKPLHRPTVQKLFLDTSTSYWNVSKAEDALMFAIYFAATVSLNQAQCQSLFGQTRNVLVSRFRLGAELALSRTAFLSSSNLMVLQAFTILLLGLRKEDDSHLSCALCTLAIHLAQALGIHRDGTNFGLSPFETEVRRRLWWNIVSLEESYSEYHGSTTACLDRISDTQLPTNIGDNSIYPTMVEWPKPQDCCTEMTNCLIKFELLRTTRRLSQLNVGSVSVCNQGQTLQLKEAMIDECHQRVEQKYLRFCDPKVPICCVSATACRLHLAKMWIITHYPVSPPVGQQSMPSAISDRLFATATDAIECWDHLRRSQLTAKWGWFIRSCMQWYAVVFVLTELCHRPMGPEHNRAWHAVESVFNEQEMEVLSKHRGLLWKILRQLMERATAHRKRQEDKITSFRLGDKQLENTDGSSSSLFIHPHSKRYEVNPTQEAEAAEAFDTDLGLLPDLGYNSTAREGSNAYDSVDAPTGLSNWGSEEMRPWFSNEQVLLQNLEFFDWPGWDAWGADSGLDNQAASNDIGSPAGHQN